MKWMMATIRKPIDHHENMKKRNDPMTKSHYSMRTERACTLKRFLLSSHYTSASLAVRPSPFEP